MNEPIFLLRESVLALHRRSLEAHGGMDGLRDPGLLESALMQPVAGYLYAQGDLADIAAAYAFHIAQSQPFVDGNKRTAITSALAFLELNGVDVEYFDGDALYDAMIGIADKRLNKAGLAALFRQQLSP